MLLFPTHEQSGFGVFFFFFILMGLMDFLILNWVIVSSDQMLGALLPSFLSSFLCCKYSASECKIFFLLVLLHSAPTFVHFWILVSFLLDMVLFLRLKWFWLCSWKFLPSRAPMQLRFYFFSSSSAILRHSSAAVDGFWNDGTRPILCNYTSHITK